MLTSLSAPAQTRWAMLCLQWTWVPFPLCRSQLGHATPASLLARIQCMDSLYRIVSHCLWQVLSDGSVKCWGANHRGQLGYGNLEEMGDQPGEMGANLPVVDLGDGMTVTHLAAGSHVNCAILQDASLKCWGSGVSGQPGPQLGKGAGVLLKHFQEIQSGGLARATQKAWEMSRQRWAPSFVRSASAISRCGM